MKLVRAALCSGYQASEARIFRRAVAIDDLHFGNRFERLVRSHGSGLSSEDVVHSGDAVDGEVFIVRALPTNQSVGVATFDRARSHIHELSHAARDRLPDYVLTCPEIAGLRCLGI